MTALGAALVANECAAFNPFCRPPGELRACPACESRALKVLDVLPDHRRRDGACLATLVTGCRTCGLVFANPLPTADELATYYAEGGRFAEDLERRGLAGATAHGRVRQTISDDEQQKLRLLFEPVAEHLDVLAPPPGARVLDYGCGPGRLLNRLQATGWTTFGIEPAIKSAFPRHHELQAPPGEPTFHLVTLHHVLEHLRNPLEVLKALSRSMLDDGILYVSVPRLDAVSVHRDLHYCLNREGHIVAYTRDCLATLFAMAGLEAVTRPEPESLDDVLTAGQPRRLRMFARKKPSAAARPAVPLRAAEAALRAYHGGSLPSMLPVRLRASRLQSARRREPLTHRWHRLIGEWREPA
jgi:2-polyprenyl-3-methyl-5-hydroxy-6-metoxy-1,4-benzoquinol methylase